MCGLILDATSAYVSIRQLTSAYVSIRQHTSADVSRRQQTSADVVERWFTAITRVVLQEADAADAEAPQLRRVRMYTFGAPRVGNSEFARFFDALGMEAFRIVNGADIVARMPRYPLTYAHVC
jgi:hypothetical protein